MYSSLGSIIKSGKLLVHCLALKGDSYSLWISEFAIQSLKSRVRMPSLDLEHSIKALAKRSSEAELLKSGFLFEQFSVSCKKIIGTSTKRIPHKFTPEQNK